MVTAEVPAKRPALKQRKFAMFTRPVVMRTAQRALALCVAGAVVLGCRDTTPTALSAPEGRASFEKTTAASDVGQSAVIDAMNASLLASGRPLQVSSAEISVAFDSAGWQGATTIIANDRTHVLSSAFVPRDPRRGGRADITYLVDASDGAALSITPAGTVVTLTNAATEPAIDASMHAWEASPFCRAPVVTKVADSGADPDLVDGLVFGNPALAGTPVADVTHAGWLPRQFFDALAPNGSAAILGVTFTFVFTDANGNPTDIDRDARADVAFREIYYNRRFGWTTDAANNRSIDIQSVAIHEAGHAYGLAHFGRLFIDNKGALKYAPKAIMNAAYVAADRAILGSDNASFCQLWANAR
jgi:hypothetical protein